MATSSTVSPSQTSKPIKSNKTTRVKRTVTLKKVSAVSDSVQAATSQLSSGTFTRLRKWNFVLGFLHALQGVAVLLFSLGKLFPVTTSYITTDPLQTAAQGTPVLALATHHLFDINLAYLVAAFFFMSAIAHLSLATWYKSRYEANLLRGINKVRWFEYAFSASTMMVAIGMLVGAQDISLLLALFGLTAVMNLCGLIMETHNANRAMDTPVNWLSYNVGSIAGIIPWLMIAIYLFGGALYGVGAPTFVYWIFVSIFLFFMSFAVNMWLQYKKIGKWVDYLYGERVYMILSLVAKSVLAWQVFAGALRP